MLTQGKILDAVLLEYKVSEADLKGPSRKRKFVDARNMFWLLTQKALNVGVCELAEVFNRSYSTAIHGIALTDFLLHNDKSVRSHYNSLTSQLNINNI
jgi:chromosomal replication initiation ATPase DnaA